MCCISLVRRNRTSANFGARGGQRRRTDIPDELDLGPFQALEASAHFDRVLYDGERVRRHRQKKRSSSACRACWQPDQVSMLLRNRKSGRAAAARTGTAASVPGQGAAPERRRGKRWRRCARNSTG